ncbi:MAG: glycosyltransferase family 2 protein [Deltaproteobacteria bacterium]|nr:glycosyltransferase family 2 protein [Deltaproteobacteria bacterium]
MKKDKTPDITVVIPIYNEEGILGSAVNDLLARLPELGRPFEIILAENGSTDRTVEIANELAARHKEVKSLSAGAPNYGLALRRGIEQAEGTFVFCDEIDICDVDFHRRALAVLESGEADLVVGSKTMKGSADRRPLGRRAATFILNRMLRVLLGFSGTDTHGLKAFRRSALIDVARSCVVDRDLFASEFVIRAERGGVKVTEIPIVIMEKRPPSINLFKRVPAVLKGMARLVVAVRLGR